MRVRRRVPTTGSLMCSRLCIGRGGDGDDKLHFIVVPVSGMTSRVQRAPKPDACRRRIRYNVRIGVREYILFWSRVCVSQLEDCIRAILTCQSDMRVRIKLWFYWTLDHSLSGNGTEYYWNLGISDTQGTVQNCPEFWGGLISHVHFYDWSSCS